MCLSFCKTIGVDVQCAVLILSVLSSSVNAQENVAKQVRYNISLPTQSIAGSLSDLSALANQSLLFSYDEVGEIKANPVVGQYTLPEALDIMLKGTGFSGSLTNRGVLMLSVTKSDVANDEALEIESMNTKRKILATAISMFVGGGAQLALAQENGTGDIGFERGMLEEIIVSATRRDLDLNDAPISIAAIGGDEINRRNLSEMSDYLRTVPGANFIEVGVGNNTVIIRGISTNPQFEASFSSATVATYFGEVPLTALAFNGGSADIKMIDLDRVEILRGPQGTLFGSSSLAGAVRNIPNPPKLDQLEGSINASYSDTSGNGAGNTKFEGMVNIPLIEDVLAVRAVVYRHDTSGYYKNIAGTQLANGGEGLPGIPLQDTVALYGGAELYRDDSRVGDTEVVGGRLAVLWRPTEALDITLQHVYQDAEQEGASTAQLNLGGYNQAIHQFDLGGIPELAGKKEGRGDEINMYVVRLFGTV